MENEVSQVDSTPQTCRLDLAARSPRLPCQVCSTPLPGLLDSPEGSTRPPLKKSKKSVDGKHFQTIE
jgi:hypothetical protein